MKKEYIRDDGKIRLCPSNIAKMNLLESMYYHRFMAMQNIIDGIIDLKNHLYIIINIFMILSLPISYPLMIWYGIYSKTRGEK